MSLSYSIFQEPWWLSAVTGDRYDEVTVTQGNKVIGRFPFIVMQRGPFRISPLPAFTHMLGPAIQPSVGKPQTQLTRRISTALDLIDQLPSFTFFKQIFDPSIDGDLAMVDGLAFQSRGFRTYAQYTFQIDCRNDPASIWDGMHTTVRQHIRRAKERYSIGVVEDPERFVHFYVRNIQKSDRENRTNFSEFSTLFSACQSRMSGRILGAFNRDGAPAAMVFLVWGYGVMYYLLSTRAPDIEDNGSISLLIWSAIEQANQLSLTFDLDGVYSNGTARFLRGFGGRIKVRVIVTRSKPVYRSLQFMRQLFAPTVSEYFT